MSNPTEEVPAAVSAEASKSDSSSAEKTDVGASARAPKLKTCKCGHDKTSPLVSASGEYTFGGWCMILFGISAKPTAIRYQCRRCDEIVGRSTDPTVIAETRLWG